MTEREIYDLYQKAQPWDGYLLIGVKGEQRNGKQVITAYPTPYVEAMQEAKK